MKKLNQKGFSAIEAVLVFVVLAAIAGAGYYVAHTHQSKTDAKDVNTAADTSVAKSAPLAKDASFQLAVDSTYYDCIEGEQVGVVTEAGGTIDEKTGDCRYNNTGGEVYHVPSIYSDDMIRGVKGLQFSAGEVKELRSVAQTLFNDCKGGEVSPTISSEINLYGEADGRYLYFGRSCGDGSREMLYLNGNTWEKIYEGQYTISCSTILKYHIPANVLVGGGGDECSTNSATKKINTLQGYAEYGQKN